MATLVVFGGAADGRLRSANADYATARAGGTLTSDTTGTLYVGQTIIAGTYYIYESFVDFDTSALPDTATVDAVTLQTYIAGNSSTTEFVVEARLYNWGGTLTTGDWIAGANLGDNTLLGSVDTTGYTTGFMTFAESGTNFQDNLSLTGTTSIMLCSDRHRGGTTPTGDEYMQFSSADTAGGSQDPHLIIQYTVDTSNTYYSSTADSYIRSVNADYATARAGGTLTTFDAGVTTGIVGQYKSTDYYVYEMFLSFDTSDLELGTTINAATLSLNGTADSSTTDFIIQARIKDWGAAVTDADWVAGADLGSLTLVATYNTVNGWATQGSTRVYFTENGTNFQENIALGGTTYLLLCSDRTADNTTPTGNEYVTGNFADAAGTTGDPMLVVDSTAGTYDITVTDSLALADAVALPAKGVLVTDSVVLVDSQGMTLVSSPAGQILPELTITLFDQDLTYPRILEQHLERRLKDKRFKTALPGGYTQLTAAMEADRQTTASWGLNYPLARLVVSEGERKVWEGQLEDLPIVKTSRTGTRLSITALGFWSSLWDQVFFDDTTYASGSYDIADVIEDILAAECPSIAGDYSHLDATGIDVVPAVFDDPTKYAGDAIQDLLAKGADDEWYGAVWEDRVFWLFQKDKSTIHWRPYWDELDEAELGWSAQNLRNRVRVRYTSGTEADTDWAEDTTSYYRFKRWREAWLSAGEISQAAAEAMRDKRLAVDKYLQRVGRIVIKDRIRNAEGTWAPAWRVRAGQTLMIPDLTPGYESLTTAEDPRILYILETEYDMEAKRLTIITESPERKL